MLLLLLLLLLVLPVAVWRVRGVAPWNHTLQGARGCNCCVHESGWSLHGLGQCWTYAVVCGCMGDCCCCLGCFSWRVGVSLALQLQACACVLQLALAYSLKPGTW